MESFSSIQKISSEKHRKIFFLSLYGLILLFLLFFFKNPAGVQGNVFFARTQDYMADYFNVAAYSSELDPYVFQGTDPKPGEHAYPPLSYLIFYPLSRTADYIGMEPSEAGHTTMGLAAAGFFMLWMGSFFLLLLYQGLQGGAVEKGLLVMGVLFSGIFLFAFERGNLIILAAGLTGYFLFYHRHEKSWVRETALVALAIAAGLKGYPALLGVLLLQEKRYMEAGRLILYGLVAVFLPFVFLKGGFGNIPIWLENLKLNEAGYELTSYPRFNFRYWFSQSSVLQGNTFLYALVKAGSRVLSLGGIAASFFLKPMWKRILVLLLVMVIFPVNSALYAGLYLLPGLVLMFNEKHHRNWDLIYLLFFLLILNPLQILAGSWNITVALSNAAASLMLASLVGEGLVQARGYRIWRPRGRSKP